MPQWWEHASPPNDPRYYPAPVPSAGVFDDPLVAIVINQWWVAHISGLLARLLNEDAWEGTPEQVAFAIAETEKLLANLTQEACMPEKPIRLKMDDTVESLNGSTWVADLSADPREYIPLNTPLFYFEGDDDIRDFAAQAAIFQLQEQLTNQQTSITAGETNLIGAVYDALQPAGVSELTSNNGLYIVIAATLADVLESVDPETFFTAFDDAAWLDIGCTLYCNMQPDGSFTEAGWLAAKAHFRAATAYPGLWADYMLALLGRKGLTNYGRLTRVYQPSETFPADCDCEA